METKKMSLIDLAQRSHETQSDYLSGVLSQGTSITYRDNSGQLVREFPNGQIETIEEKE